MPSQYDDGGQGGAGRSEGAPEFEMRGKVVIDGVYELLEKIGEGGMAEIYRSAVDLDAFDYSLQYVYSQAEGKTHAQRQTQARELAGRLEKQALDPRTVRSILEAQHIPVPPAQVALKVSKPEADGARFKAEWQYLMCLNHPHIIHVYGGGVWKGRPYYSMELFQNFRPISEVAPGLPLKTILKLIIQAGHGLAYLHENGIVHRDIKPSNLMILGSGPEGLATKVVDLGLAKAMDGTIMDRIPDPRPDEALDGSPGQTLTRQVLGTVNYMPPEQMLNPQTVDPRADVYALASTLCELATGESLFPKSMGFMEIVRNVAQGGRPAPLDGAERTLPVALVDTLKRAMRWKREERYGSMREFLRDLETLAF